MTRNRGKFTFWIGTIMSMLLIYYPTFAQPPQPKMERVLEELRERVKEMEEKDEGILGKILKRVELHGLLE